MKKFLECLAIIMILAILIIFIYIQASSYGTCYKSQKNIKIPIFIYHDIVEDESQIKVNYMQTTYKRFDEQITGLMKLGYVPISYDDLIAYNNGEKAIPKRSILITFDDGFSGVYKYAYQFAKEYKIPITSFIINYNVGTDGYFTWDEAKEMSDSGLVSIYSHSMEHLKYNEQTPEKLLEDVNKSFNQIEQKVEKVQDNKVFTYPYGLYTIEEQQLLKENQIIQNLTDDKVNVSNSLNIYGLHRMYPMSDPAWKLYLKIEYRAIKYKD